MRYVVLRIYDIVSNAEIANHNHKSGIANQFLTTTRLVRGHSINSVNLDLHT